MKCHSFCPISTTFYVQKTSVITHAIQTDVVKLLGTFLQLFI